MMTAIQQKNEKRIVVAQLKCIKLAENGKISHEEFAQPKVQDWLLLRQRILSLKGHLDLKNKTILEIFDQIEQCFRFREIPAYSPLAQAQESVNPNPQKELARIDQQNQYLKYRTEELESVIKQLQKKQEQRQRELACRLEELNAIGKLMEEQVLGALAECSLHEIKQKSTACQLSQNEKIAEKCSPNSEQKSRADVMGQQSGKKLALAEKQISSLKSRADHNEAVNQNNLMRGEGNMENNFVELKSFNTIDNSIQAELQPELQSRCSHLQLESAVSSLKKKNRKMVLHLQMRRQKMKGILSMHNQIVQKCMSLTQR